MFDAKSLFEQMLRGANPSANQQPTSSGLGDIGDLLRQFTQQPGSQQSGQEASPGGGALDDLLRQFTQGGAPQAGNAGQGSQGSQGGSSGGASALDELMRQFTQGRDSAANDTVGRGGMQELPDAASPSAGSPGAGGGLGDLLGGVFGNGAPQHSGDQGGGQPGLKELLEKLGGSGGAGSNDLVRQLTDFIGNNKVGAGVALGGLGALIFGTQTGRSVAMSAAKVGALAVVGGLAYKAYQNYSQGRPLVSGSTAPEAAPQGTGFEAENVSNEAAVTYIRGMIAAAAADGRISAEEQRRVIGSLAGQGMDAGAEEFLANELNNPASINDLVNGVSSQTEALQLYTSARIAIEPDTASEQQFLAVLADRLGIAPDLRAHVDAAARSMS